MLLEKSLRDQLLVGLKARLVEQSTGIPEVMGSNLVQARMFFQASISQLLNLSFIFSPQFKL